MTNIVYLQMGYLPLEVDYCPPSSCGWNTFQSLSDLLSD